MRLELITPGVVKYNFPQDFELHPRLPDGFLIRYLKESLKDEDRDWIVYEMRDQFSGRDFETWFIRFKFICNNARRDIEDYIFNRSEISMTGGLKTRLKSERS